jgi:predicted phage-related endonuclease
MTFPLNRYPRHADRRYFIGGSDARIIMGTDETALARLWLEKRGEEEPPDYSDNLIVQLGVATEPINRLWYEKTTGQAINFRGLRLGPSSEYSYRQASAKA